MALAMDASAAEAGGSAGGKGAKKGKGKGGKDDKLMWKPGYVLGERSYIIGYILYIIMVNIDLRGHLYVRRAI